MRRVSVVLLVTAAVVGGVAGTAGADPTPASHGCQTVAQKFLNPEAPGHQGVQNAASHGTGEGPCGFGTPPGHE